MALNPRMPDDAGIDTEEFNEGTRTVEREERGSEEPRQNRSAVLDNETTEREARQDDAGEAGTRERTGERREQREQRDGEHTEREESRERREGDEEQTEEERRASDAARELSQRRRGLEGRKQTIQQQINELVRERENTRRDTEAGRREREELRREIESLRSQRDRVARGEDVDDDRGRDESDPRRFDPRRPNQGRRDRDYDETRAPWYDPRDARPVEENFRDFAEYAEAVGRWGARMEVRRAEYTRSRREEQSSRQQWEEQRQTAYRKRYEDFAAANPDFEAEVDRDDLYLTAPMVDAIKGSEVGPQMLLHLARHPEDIDRIGRLHPVLAFGEMKKIEARVESANSGSRPRQEETNREHSSAPRPIKPVESTSSRHSDDMDIPDENVSDDEHFERMNKRDAQLAKRGVNTRKSYGVRV